MLRISIILIFNLLIMLLDSEISAGQEQKTLIFSPESEVTVDGTSNRDDWTVTVPQFEGSVTIQQNDGNTPDIMEAQFIVKAQSMTGGNNIMDRLMLNALRANQHPEIIFMLSEVETITEGGNDQVFLARSTGDLTLAGVTRSITLDLEGEVLENGSYRFQGSHALLMSDYDIERPTAMFGSLVTGDEVVINLDLTAVEH